MGALARSLAVLAALTAVALIAPVAASPAAGGQVRAGAAAVDASWHVGASAGQYATDGSFVGAHGVDPATHSYRKNALLRHPVPPQRPRAGRRGRRRQPRRGRQERPLHPAGPAVPPHRPAAASRATPGSRARTSRWRSRTTTPRRTTRPPSWGAWTFQDVFDVRFFDYYAKRMAEAVERGRRRS